MRRALLSLGTILLLALPAFAQERSVISAGPLHGGRPHPPGGTFTRPGFSHFHRNRFDANHFGTVLYPFGLYDGFYSEPYPEVVEQPPPVVVIREERPAPAPAASAPEIPPPEPKMIQVPEEAATRPIALAKAPPAVFILSDGHRLEAQNYTITDSLLTIYDPRQPAIRVPLSKLNIEATLAENRQRGLDLRLPENGSEIFVGF